MAQPFNAKTMAEKFVEGMVKLHLIPKTIINDHDKVLIKQNGEMYFPLFYPTRIGVGTLIKLVYFSRYEDQSIDDKMKRNVEERIGISNGNRRSYLILGGRLHFMKFEIRKLNECLYFISSKQLHRGRIDSHYWNSNTLANKNTVIKATESGAYKFADIFKERLRASFDK
ncbi:hypothetical protein PTKIN_Ptkin19aG0021800 [Pterospermum kingtungense]